MYTYYIYCYYKTNYLSCLSACEFANGSEGNPHWEQIFLRPPLALPLTMVKTK